MALTGLIYGNTCYASTTDAYNDYFVHQTPFQYTSGGYVYTDTYSYHTGVWYKETWAATQGTTSAWINSSMVAPLPDLPSCDPQAAFQDGMTLALLVAGAMIMASMWGVVARAK